MAAPKSLVGEVILTENPTDPGLTRALELLELARRQCDNLVRENSNLRQRIHDRKRSPWDEVQRGAHAVAKAKGWWDEDHGPHTTAAKLALIHAEVSEALEAARRSPPDASSEHIPEFTAFEEELADIVIRTMDLAEARGCRLRAAILAKLEFNKTRPMRHGGKEF